MAKSAPDTSAPARAVYEYDIPDELAPLATTKTFGAIKSIGIVLLTPYEEKLGASRCKGDPMQLGYELAKISLAEVNGKPVTSVDGTQDIAYGEMHPQIRSLLVQAYSDNSVAPDSASTSFLKSRKIKA